MKRMKPYEEFSFHREKCREIGEKMKYAPGNGTAASVNEYGHFESNLKCNERKDVLPFVIWMMDVYGITFDELVEVKNR